MTKIERMIQSINRKIELAEIAYNEAKEGLNRQITYGGGVFDPVFVKQYADRMNDKYQEIVRLREQLDMLEYLMK